MRWKIMMVLLHLITITITSEAWYKRPIFFVSNRDGQDAIYYMNEKGKITKIFTPPEELLGSTRIVIGMSLSPMGDQIAFSMLSGELCTVKINGLDFKILGRGASPSWSPDGREIVFTAKEGICSINLRTLEIRKISDDGGRPEWSPNGEVIAFNRNREQIVLINPDGTNPRVIYDAKSGPVKYLGNLAWSPDGKMIAFVASVRETISVIDSDGENFKFLFPNPRGEIRAMIGVDSPCWSFDGKEIVFMRTKSEVSSNWDIYIMNHNGFNKRPVIATDFYEGSPIFAKPYYDVSPLEAIKIGIWGMIKCIPLSQ